MKKTAIVTGGNGFLGRHLVQRLVNDGWQVTVLSRSAKASTEKRAQVRQCSVDMTDLAALREAFASVSVVFHCAALSSAWGRYEDFYQANVEGTRNVLRCCNEFGVPRFVYVSSTSVYFGFGDAQNIKESDAVVATFANAYAETKYLGEQVTLAERGNVDVRIVRPRGIIGDGDEAIMPRILRVANSGFFPLLNGGQALVDVTYVKNVAQALLLCALAEGQNGEIFNISNGEPMTVRALLEKALQGKKVKYLAVPARLLLGVAAVQEWVARLTGAKEPRLTRYGVGLLAYSQVLNIDKAQQRLGYQPEYSLQQGIDNYLQWEQSRV